MINVIDIPIYRCSAIALIGASKQEWLEFYSTHREQITEKDNVRVCDEFDDNIPGFVIATEGNDYVVYVSDKDKIGLTVHELLHTAYMILSHRGYQHGQDSEALAYLLEYITNEFYLIADKEEY